MKLSKLSMPKLCRNPAATPLDREASALRSQALPSSDAPWQSAVEVGFSTIASAETLRMRVSMRRAWMKVNCLTDRRSHNRMALVPAANLRRELGEVVPYILLLLSLGFGGRRGCFHPLRTARLSDARGSVKRPSERSRVRLLMLQRLLGGNAPPSVRGADPARSRSARNERAASTMATPPSVRCGDPAGAAVADGPLYRPEHPPRAPWQHLIGR